MQLPYGGPVVLFRAEQGLEAYRADVPDWRELATGGVEYIQVSGGHHDMLSLPHVSEIARLLQARLDSPRAAGLVPAPIA